MLKGIVAQRLVRRLCPACAEPVPAATLPAEARPPAGREGAVIRRAVGCRACEGTGYRGRTAILEIMPVDEAVSRLIDAGAMADALIAAARRAGMYTLWESGLERVWEGTTSLDEVIRVLGERVPEDGTQPARARDGGHHRRSPAPRGDAAVPGPGRVLIADDDPQMRRLIRGVLQRDGFEVVEACRRPRCPGGGGTGRRGPGDPGRGHAPARRPGRAGGAPGAGPYRLPAGDRADCTARRDRGKGIGSRRPRLPEQAGADPLPRRPESGRCSSA